jgi:hypothetical protein
MPEHARRPNDDLIGVRGTGPLVKIEPQWLTRIILGKNMSPDNQKHVCEWAKQRDPELHVVNAYFDEFHQEIRLKG